jgi:hypothetical protein
MITPPVRAVLLGIAGAITRSVKTKAYESPRVFLPSAFINKKAILVPNPVLIKPLDIKNAQTINQIVASVKAANVWPMVSVRVNTGAVMAMMATAPMGSGWRINAAIVAIVIANTCHALSAFQLSAAAAAGILPSARAVALAASAVARALATKSTKPCGVGINQIITPIKTQIMPLTSLESIIFLFPSIKHSLKKTYKT